MNEMEKIGAGSELEQMTPEQLGTEIRLLTSQARKIGFVYAVEIGHRLVLAKEKVAHGEWIDWVARETTLSQSNANKMMRLYEECGERQESLFGAELNSSALTNLSVTNALQLLVFPPEEREQVAAELDAEHLSSRELAEAIKARKAAEQRAADAERALHEVEEAARLAKAKAEAEAAEKLAALQKKLDKAERERDKLKDAAGKAESGAADKIAAAKKAAAEARQELEAAQKQLKASTADAARFGVYFHNAQEDINRMMEIVREIREHDPETADKLCTGVRFILQQTLDRIPAKQEAQP